MPDQIKCTGKEFDMPTKYRIHRFDLRMTADQSKLEQFLNSLEGEIIAIIPNVTIDFLWIHKVDFLLIVEKVN
jgi:hypothetical protein